MMPRRIEEYDVEMAPVAARRYDLDWLRTLAVILLFFFHSARPFDPLAWHIKNGHTSGVLLGFIGFIDQFHTPLFFLLAGSGAWFALSVRTKEEFVYERVLRLFVPMVCAVFLVAVPQMYFERVHRGAFQGSFLAFLPHVFDRVEGFDDVRVGSHHLWFLEYLFYLSIAALPLFVYLREGRGRTFIDRVAAICERGGLLVWFAVPLIVAEIALRFRWPDSRGDLFYDWGNVFDYSLFLVYGYVLAADERFDRALAQCWPAALVLGLAGFGLFGAAHLGLLPLDSQRELGYAIQWTAHALAAWALVVAWLGLAQKHLRFTNRFLAYAVEAMLPVYILHQAVIVGVAFYVVQWQVPMPAKYLVILAASLGLTAVLYEFVVRRLSLLRLMFGMRPKKREPSHANGSEAQQRVSDSHVARHVP